MTNLVREVLQERAEQVRPTPVDLSGVLGRGDRRLRRRRWFGLAAATAAGAMVAGAVVLGGPGGSRPGDDLGYLAKPALSYAVGDTLYLDGRTVRVDRAVRLMVPVAGGVIYGDADGTLWRLHGDRSSEIGRTVRMGEWIPRVVASDDGRRVAWLEPSDSDSGVDLALLSIDPSADADPVRVPLPATAGEERQERPGVVAIDGDTVYVADGTEVTAYRGFDTAGVAQREVEGDRVIGDVARDGELADVAAGRFLHQVDPEGADFGMTVTGSVADRGAIVGQVSDGDLSPDGSRWFTEDADEFSVYDSRTGERTDPAHPGFAFAAPYAWIDDDTIAALALATADENAPISLLTCRVSTNACTVSARDIGHYGETTIPVGTVLGD